MRLRTVGLALIAMALLVAPLVGGAQQERRVHRIGFLSTRSASDMSAHFDAFRRGLRELGWVEGQNIVIESRFAEGKFDRLPALAAELVRLKVDVIVTAASPAAAAAKEATTSIPIVMASGGGDPVKLGLIASLARPGGNLTGVSWSVGPEIYGKQLELLTETVPKVRRVAMLSNPANPCQPLAIREAKRAAPALGVQLHLLEVRAPSELEAAFATMANERVGALLVAADSMFGINRTRLAELATRSRLPAAYGAREIVEAGGLMSYAPSVLDFFRRAATFVDKILKGAKPGDIPVEQPTKYELVINLKTARTLGVTIPPSLLLRADEVIQ